MSDPPPIMPDPPGGEAEKALLAARVCRMRKDPWGALVEAQRACNLSPDSVAAHEMASEIARELTQWDEAVRHLEMAQTLDPGNEERAARLEKLKADAVVFSRSVKEVVSEAREGEESWKTVFRAVFLRPDPVWHRAGWFNGLLAFAGFMMLVLAARWVLASGPWLFLIVLLHLGMTAWVAYDAYQHGEPAVFWGPVSLIAPLFGFILYLSVRSMSSGIGMDGGGRFFSS